MGISESELLERAILDGLYRKYRKELRVCKERAICSDVHDHRVQKILHPSYAPAVLEIRNPSEEIRHGRLSKRAWLVVLIAAVLMLSGCAAYLCRKEIGNLIEERFPKFFKLTFKTEASPSEDIIEEKYIVTYVPEGYHQTKEEIYDSMLRYEWIDGDGHCITFEQGLKEGLFIVLDNEFEEYTLLEAGGRTVYCRKLKRSVCYVWEDGRYVFVITVPDEVYNTEVLQMIETLRMEE